MTKFSREIAILKRIEKSFDDSRVEAVRVHSDVMEKLFTDEQLFQGQDSLGVKIAPPYSEAYKKRKRRLGLPTDRVTWKLTGRLYANTRVMAEANGYKFLLNTEYAKFLVKRYGKRVIGLNTKNRADFALRYVLPIMKRNAINAIKGA